MFCRSLPHLLGKSFPNKFFRTVGKKLPFWRLLSVGKNLAFSVSVVQPSVNWETPGGLGGGPSGKVEEEKEKCRVFPANA